MTMGSTVPAGLPVSIPILTLCSTAPASEISVEFLQGMVNRMGVSYYKYGPVAAAYPAKVDALACLEQRLEKYRETHNTEYLIDAANFAMIEALHPADPLAFYEATDSDGSTGRVRHDGKVSHAGNQYIGGKS